MSNCRDSNISIIFTCVGEKVSTVTKLKKKKKNYYRAYDVKRTLYCMQLLRQKV